MAGKVGLAAKLFLATTVLAGGGTGAYYGTRLGWPELLHFEPSATPVQVTDDSPESNRPLFAEGDLDAVASAWAEPESSPTARTARVEPARAEFALPPNDRYVQAAVPAVPAAQTPPDSETTRQQQQAENATTTAAADPAKQELQLSIDKPVESPTAADFTPAPELARGQEPKDDPLPEVVTELQPIPAAAQERDTDSAQQQVLSDPGAQPTTIDNDRYGAAPAPLREPAIVNPFGSQAPSDAPTPNPPESIEPLPSTPDEISGELTELPQHDNMRPIKEASRMHGEADTRAARDIFSRQEPPSTGNAFNSQRADAPNAASSLPPLDPEQAPAGEGRGRPGERALEGAQRPAFEIQKFAPAEIQVGKPAKFVVQIRNVGAQAVDGVTIRDEVPQGTRLISSSPTAENNGGELLWELGKLSPGEDRTVELQLMPLNEGEIGSVATVTYSAQASVKTRCTMPQLAIRMTAPDKVMIGQEQRVKIELRNPGSGDATGVMLFENVPQNVRHAAGPTLEFEVGTLKAGETRELELVLLAEKAGKTVNVLSARADGNLQVQQQVEFEVIAPELTVAVEGPERRYLERPATYEVSVENPGTAPAHDVQIITKLPKGLRFVRANNMGEYDAASHAVYWSLAELPEGESGTVELVAMPVETGSQTLEVESRASEGLADHAQREIVIDGLAAIMFELRDLEDPIEVHGETGYEIRVANQGTKSAKNVQVAVNLPPGLQLVSAEGETQHTVQHGRIVFDPIAELAPKADTLYRIRVQCMQPGDQRVIVEVSTDDVAQPIRREESTHVFGDD